MQSDVGGLLLCILCRVMWVGYCYVLLCILCRVMWVGYCYYSMQSDVCGFFLSLGVKSTQSFYYKTTEYHNIYCTLY